MRARFFSDINLENFVDEAATIHEVDVVRRPGNREVTMAGVGHLIPEMTALIQINGGDVISETDE